MSDKAGPFFDIQELIALGFRSVGTNVRVSRKSSFYCISGSIGSNVRIDDFCIVKGHIEIGSHVHIAGFCSVSGVCGMVKLGDFSTLANRVSVYTGSDDYRAEALSSVTVPEKYLVTIKGDVTLGRAALIGAHSILLPGAAIGDAASIGGLCIVHGAIPTGAIVVASAAGFKIKGKRCDEKILRMADEVMEQEQ